LKIPTDSGRFNDFAEVIFDQALISEGGQLKDPVAFVKKINQFLVE